MLWVERMLAFDVLPKLYRQVRMQSLKRAVEAHLEQTKEHVARVEQCFRDLGVEPSSNRSAAIDALARQHDELGTQIVEERLADLFHATAAAHTEHYEIAAYTGLIDLLHARDEKDAARLLEQNKADEEATLAGLEEIGRRLVRELEPS